MLRVGIRILLLFGAALLSACGQGEKKESTELQLQMEKEEAPKELKPYRAEAKPFSPTLGGIFANGRIVVIPEYAALAGIEADPAAGYAFSAIDGHGRLYHFYRSAKWAMGDIEPLSVELPSEGWNGAWNNQTRSLELIVTAPHGDQQWVTLYRLQDRQWKRVPVEVSPKSAARSVAAHEAVSGSWFYLSDDQATSQSLARFDRVAWDEIPAPNGPAYSDVRWMGAFPPANGLAALTAQGEVWLWTQGAWSKEIALPRSDYKACHFDPTTSRLVLAAGQGVGTNVIHSLRIARGDTALENDGPSVTPCDLVSVNDETEGVWDGIGRVVYSAVESEEGESTETQSTFVPGVEGEGELGLSVETRQGGAYWEADEVDSIEFAPQIANLLPDRGAFIPATGGFVEVSSIPSGAVRIAGARFPFVGEDDRITTEALSLEARATMRLRHSRFWRFEATEIEWIPPYPEIHPDLDFQTVSADPEKGTHDLLAWFYPEEGLLQYQYTRRSPNKVQWSASPVLTLRSLPETNSEEGERFWMLEPAVVGDPPQIIQAGWVGNLRPAEGGEGFIEAPTRGFFARAMALSPDEWISSPLPIPFMADAKLVTDSVSGRIYLLGGRRIKTQKAGDRNVLALGPNRDVWVWRDDAWAPLETEGRAPDLSMGFAAEFDAFRRRVLVLCAEGMFSLDGERWTLVSPVGEKGEGISGSLRGLKIHPVTGEIVGVWVGEQTRIGIWREEGWSWVRMDDGEEWNEARSKLQSPDDLRPLMNGNWAVTDSRALSGLRDARSLKIAEVEGEAWEVNFEVE